MARDNPTNPFTRDPDKVRKDVPMPISKAKVMAVKDHPDQFGFHIVKIRVYGDDSPYLAPVIAPSHGSVWLPQEGQDVAVIFGHSDKPWVIGAWYAIDRVEDGDADLPAYEPGDLRLGNESGSHITVHGDGHISIITDDEESIDIDTQNANTYLDNDQSVAGDDTYYIIQFNTEEDDQQDLFDPSTHTMTLLHDGRYTVNATVALPTPGQNNRYTLAVFRNGNLEKRKSRQSSTNFEMSLDVDLDRNMFEGDEIDIRLRHNRGASSTVVGSRVTNNFNIKRTGI